MNEQLISFETEKLAKEKGFDFSDLEYRDSKTFLLVANANERLRYFKTKENSGLIKRPTQSLLQKWLREKHDIHIQIGHTYCNNAKQHCYYIKRTFTPCKFIGVYFDSYEEALESSLLEALKLLK